MNKPYAIIAFTLIEMLIAIGLGSVIILTAIAGFRVAAQSSTVATRLSIENALIRDGIIEANDQVDFWTDYDDPNASAAEPSTRQALRGFSAVSVPDASGRGARPPRGGLPFTPLSAVFPKSRLAGASANDREAEVGVDPDECWAASDPRTWWRGCLQEKDQSTLGCGRYALFSNTALATEVKSVDNDSEPPHTSSLSTYGTVTIPHHWLANQTWGLQSAMGYYAFIDYLPANALYSCYMPLILRGWIATECDVADGLTTNGGMPWALVRYCSPDHGYFNSGPGNIETTLNRRVATSGATYGVRVAEEYNEDGSVTHPDQNQLIRDAQWYWPLTWRTNWQGTNTTATDYATFIRESTCHRDLLPQRPQHWPTAEIRVSHFIHNDRFVNLCRVRCTSPVTGQVMDFSFSTFGTTMRGARAQRRHPADGGGWARWDNDGSANDRTLDSP